MKGGVCDKGTPLRPRPRGRRCPRPRHTAGSTRPRQAGSGTDFSPTEGEGRDRRMMLEAASRSKRTLIRPGCRSWWRGQRTDQGNTEGTPTRAPAGARGHSSSADCFFLRGFRARGFPRLPSVPASSLDGKEGRWFESTGVLRSVVVEPDPIRIRALPITPCHHRDNTKATVNVSAPAGARGCGRRFRLTTREECASQAASRGKKGLNKPS